MEGYAVADENMAIVSRRAVAWDSPDLKMNFAMFFLGFSLSPQSYLLRCVSSPLAEEETEVWEGLFKNIQQITGTSNLMCFFSTVPQLPLS